MDFSPFSTSAFQLLVQGDVLAESQVLENEAIVGLFLRERKAGGASASPVCLPQELGTMIFTSGKIPSPISKNRPDLASSSAKVDTVGPGRGFLRSRTVQDK